jgi:hypothetical protein
MLVYANSFVLNPAGGPKDVIERIASWLGKPRSAAVDPTRLTQGVRELKLTDGFSVSSIATVDAEGKPVFPYHFCAKLIHGQEGVSGRRWVTEIGLKQTSSNESMNCSVLLRTDEVSTKVNAPIHVTRPIIVQTLLEQCKPIGHTPGLGVKTLNEHNAAAFCYEIEHANRDYPLVLISRNREGQCAVQPERLRSILIGLASVIDIPADANTYEMERTLGRQFSAFGGAINIIFPNKGNMAGSFYRTILLRPDRLDQILAEGIKIETEILATITHSTNLPHSWRHISSEIVAQEILRGRLRAAAANAHESEEENIYEALLAEAAAAIDSKELEMKSLRDEVEVSGSLNDQLAAENEGLRHALSGSGAKSAIDVQKAASLVAPLRDLVVAAIRNESSLEQSLHLISAIFPDRVIILESAFSSAQDSDKRGFAHQSVALDLLMKLSDTYWKLLSDGKGDGQARLVFGKNDFSAKESESLSSDGKKRRTFSYLGRDMFMEKHLKHGVKDSSSETLRVHFDWLSDQRKIVIGHCGKHLDF